METETIKNGGRTPIIQNAGDTEIPEYSEDRMTLYTRNLVKTYGKRTVVNLYDARILKAFLTGEKTWRGDFGDERSLKKSLPRLRQLLGTGDAPRSESGEYKDIKVETDL